MSNRGIISSAGDDSIPDTIVRDLKSQDLATKTEAVLAALNMLRAEPHVAGNVVASTIAPLVHALDMGWPYHHEALHVLASVAFETPEHTLAVVTSGAIPKLISFLASEDLVDRAILILGNIALYGPAARHAVLSRGAVRAMLPHMRTDTPVRRLRTFVRAYSNLCSHSDDDDDGDDSDKKHLEYVSPALPYIHDILDIENEESLDPDDKEVPFIACDVIVDACTALSNIMLGPDECIEAVQLVPGLTARLVGLLGHEGAAVREAALSAVGNMLAGTDVQVDRCLDANCLDHIMTLLQSDNPSLVMIAARATSNILAGTHAQTQLTLEKDILTLLGNILADGDFECRKQAARAITCLCVCGTAAQCGRVVSGALEPYCALLAAAEDCWTTGDVLDGLSHLIQAAERGGNVKQLCYVLDELDVLDNMHLLLERVTDEGQRCKLENMRVLLRKHAREERSIVYDKKEFTSETIVRELECPHQLTQTRASRALYYMLHEQSPPIHALLEAGILAPLVAGLDRNTCSDFLYVAAWTLSKITAKRTRISNHQLMAIMESGAIPKLIALLVQGDKITELAACSLGDLAWYRPDINETLLAHVRSEISLSELTKYVRTYRDLCWSQSVNFECKKRPLPFVSLLLSIEDKEIIEDVCMAYIKFMPSECGLGMELVQSVPGLTARLVGLMAHEALEVKKAALMIVILMLKGTDVQADRCLEAGCLGHLVSHLGSNEPELVYFAIGATCNFFLHKQSHIEQALEKEILTPLTNVLARRDKCQEIAVIAMTNLCSKGSATQRARLVLSGALQPYCALLRAEDLPVAGEVLCGLYILLFSLQAANKDQELKILCLKLDKLGVIEQIQQLLEQRIDEDLRLKAVKASAILRQLARGERVIVEEGELFTLEKIVRDLKSCELEKQTRAVQAAWSMLSEPAPPRTAMIKAGIIPPLVAVLDKHDWPDLQDAAASAIGCIAEGTHRHKVAIANSGVIPKLITSLSHGGRPALLAANILAHISYKAPVTRDMVLAHGVVRAILPHLRRDAPLDLMRCCVQLYSSLCLVIVSTSMFELVLPALPYISELLDVKDEEVLCNVCHAIDDLMYVSEQRAVVKSVPGLTARLVGLLGHEAVAVRQAAFSVVGNAIGLGDAQSNQHWLDAGCFAHIVSSLQSREPSLLEQALLATCNMLHSLPHAQLALELNMHSALLKILADAEPNSFLEYYAITALGNFTSISREHKVAVFNAADIPNLVALISRRAIITAEVVRVLGNLAVAGPEARDMILAHGAVRAMMPHMRPDEPLELLQSCMRAYSTFCANITSMSVFELLSPALPCVYELLYFEDETVLAYACGALHNVMLSKDECIERVQLVPGTMARLARLLRHETVAVREAALNAVGNMMIAGKEVQFNRCLDAGCLGSIASILQCSEPLLVEEAVKITCSLIAHSKYSHSLQQKVLEENVVVAFLNILVHTELNSSLQYLMLTTLNNLAVLGTREHRMILVTAGFIPKLVTFIPHGDNMAKQAIRILILLAGHEPDTTGLILAHGAVRAMLPHMRRDAPSDLLVGCLIAYCLFCRGNDDEPTEMLEFVSPALPNISNLLDIDDEDILSYACSSLTALARTNEGVEAVQAVPGLTARLVRLLGGGGAAVNKNAFDAVFNMLLGTETQIERCLSAGYIDHIVPLLQCSDPAIVEKASQLLSKILGDKHWIQRALEAGIFVPLLNLLANAEPDSCVQLYVLLGLVTTTTVITPENTTGIIDGGAIPMLVAHLSRGDNLAELAACGLVNLSKCGSETSDMILAHGAVRAMLPHMRVDTPLDLLNYNMMIYRNLCGNVSKSRANLELLKAALPNIFELLEIGDENILKHVCWACFDLLRSCEGIELEQLVPGLTERLVGLLGGGRASVKDNNIAINLVMLMLSGNDTQVDHCLAAGCVEHILSYLECRDPSLMEEAVKATHDTLGADHPWIQRALDEDSLTPLMAILACPPKGQIRTLKAICNVYRRASCAVRARLVSRGALQPCGALLAARGPAAARAALHALHELMQIEAIDGNLEAVRLKLVEIGVLEQIKQMHQDNESGTIPWLARLLSHEVTVAEPAALVIGDIAEDKPETRVLLVAQEAPATNTAEEAPETGSLLVAQEAPAKNIADEEPETRPLLVAQEAPGTSTAEEEPETRPLLVAQETPAKNTAKEEPEMRPLLVTQKTPGKNTAEEEPETRPLLVAQETPAKNTAEEEPETRPHLVAQKAQATTTAEDKAKTIDHMLPQVPVEPEHCAVQRNGSCSHDDKISEKLENVSLNSLGLPQIAELLNSEDADVTERTCWALVGLMKTNEAVEVVQATPGVTARLVGLLRHEGAEVKRAAVAAVMLMLSGTDTQVDRCLAAGCVEHFISFLECRDPSLIERARGAAQDTLGAAHPLLQRAMDEDSLTPLMTILACDSEEQKQAVRAIGNLCRRASCAQRARLVSRGALQPCGALLAARGAAVAGAALDALHELMQAAKNDGKVKRLRSKVIKTGIVEQLQQLQEHPDEEVKEKANHLLSVYFPSRSRHNGCCSIS